MAETLQKDGELCHVADGGQVPHVQVDQKAERPAAAAVVTAVDATGTAAATAAAAVCFARSGHSRAVYTYFRPFRAHQMARKSGAPPNGRHLDHSLWLAAAIKFGGGAAVVVLCKP
eukprot:358126-Chlamydomonas_euryale.AAC.5